MDKMRNILIIMLVIFYSCGSENQESKTPDSPSKANNTANTETSKAVDIEPWKDWNAPVTLNGYTLDALIIDPYKSSGLYSALAVYKNEDKVIRVQIMDGSTEKGKSEIRQHSKIATENINSESEYGYEKTLEHNGMKAKEEFLKGANEYMIKFLYHEKYGVSVKSNAESAEEIWNVIDQLQLDKLN